MKTWVKSLIVVIIILIIIAIPMISSYNTLVNLEQNVNVAESNIDLIPNLVNTVKGYASQEKDIFTEIADARSKLAGANNITEQANADSELSGALSRLLLVVENYPDLKSNQNFQDLSIQLEGTENRIAIARQDYNTAATTYNTKVKSFPTKIVASLFGFQEKPLYKATEGAQQVPEVNFSS